jgi:L-lactate dehydrogenase complex protein LldG
MSETTRMAFLTRVRAAARAGSKYREAPRPELPGASGYIGAGDDPLCYLVDELIKVGADATRVHTNEELGSLIESVVERHSIRSAIMNAAGIVNNLDVLAPLRAAGVDCVTIEHLSALDETARRDRLFTTDLGVAAPDWAIAETGTLVYASGPAQTRSATLLPPVHLAVVDAECVLHDLLDLPARLTGRSVDGVLPRNVALVTGPSKTGDIELKLTTGVHGPGAVHVLIWDPQ